MLGVDRLDVGLREVGMQLDLVDRRDDVGAVEQPREVLDLKLLTPIARTRPSASSVSSALVGLDRASKWVGSGWWSR